MPLPNPCEENRHRITIVMTTDPGNVADGDRLWDSYFAYLENGHGTVILQDGLVVHSLWHAGGTP